MTEWNRVVPAKCEPETVRQLAGVEHPDGATERFLVLQRTQ